MADQPTIKPPFKSVGQKQPKTTLKPRELMGMAGLAKSETAFCQWRVKVLSLFPEMFPGPLGHSLTGKALKSGLWSLETLDIRQFARDKHRTVDDTPAGGGVGMVLRPDIVGAAIDAAQQDVPKDRNHWPVLYLSPRGKPLTQTRAKTLAECQGVTLLCGRYEGIDQRVLEARQVEEISLGDFILTGGELPAMALIDSVVRLLPGVLGKIESTEEESFSAGLLEHPHYTRPQEWEGRAIPEVLLSGHHTKIVQWRRAQSEAMTKKQRPDLWRAYQAQETPQDMDTDEVQSNRMHKP